jgi:serine O-acetyltransferase
MVGRGRERRRWVRERHAQSPPLREALAADVATTLHFRGEGRGHLSRTEVALEILRLSWTSDAFLAQVLYRGRVSALRRGIPVVPRLFHFGSMTLGQVCIGDPVLVRPGLYLPHGQVVVDGITEVGSQVILFPWTTVGLRGGNFQGPVIGDGVHVGSGARVIGPVSVGPSARIGANAVVVGDVPAGRTAVGVPARMASRV